MAKILISLSSNSFRKIYPGTLTFKQLKVEIGKHPKTNPYTVIYDVSDERETTVGDNIFNLLKRKFGNDENEVVCINWGGSWYCAGFNLTAPV